MGASPVALNHGIEDKVSSSAVRKNLETEQAGLQAIREVGGKKAFPCARGAVQAHCAESSTLPHICDRGVREHDGDGVCSNEVHTLQLPHPPTVGKNTPARDSEEQ